MSRTFTVVSSCVDSSGGRYKSATPASAAKKAATRLFKKAKASQKFKTIRRITFALRETTAGSDKTVYDYKANRVKLAKPVVRVIAGKEVVNNFKIEIEADMKKRQALKCKKVQRETMMMSTTSGGNHNKKHRKSSLRRKHRGGESDGDEEVEYDTPEPESEPEPDTNAEIMSKINDINDNTDKDKTKNESDDESGMGGGAKRRKPSKRNPKHK